MEERQAARGQMQARLEALKEELETGQTELQKLDEQRASLHATMLRISGAVQVLEELLAAEDPAEDPVA
jgi:prefoldin subunit 5